MTSEQYKKLSAPSEETEQIHLMIWCTWAQAKYPELEAIYHIPNEGKRSKVTGGRLKSMGMRPGVPDICLPVPRGKFSGLYIELKKIGGKPTDNQIDWLELLDRYGHCVALCEGAEAAEEIITAYCERDADKLDGLRLSSERGDFDRLRTPVARKRKTAAKADIRALIYFAGAVLQLTAIIADCVMHHTITGLSLTPALIALTLALARQIARDMLG